MVRVNLNESPKKVGGNLDIGGSPSGGQQPKVDINMTMHGSIFNMSRPGSSLKSDNSNADAAKENERVPRSLGRACRT